jgi:hypothetical protein
LSRVSIVHRGAALVALAIASSSAARAQSSPSLDTSMVRFFSGRWSCAGEFASHKPLAAIISFTPVLGGAWLEMQHDDVPPGQYHATAMWGVDKPSGKFVAMVYDVSPSVRLFTTDGWKSDAITIENAPLLAPPRYRERFTYKKESDASFRMTWETSRDGATWAMGDYLVCTR